jgi:hypothetical protein
MQKRDHEIHALSLNVKDQIIVIASISREFEKGKGESKLGKKG